MERQQVGSSSSSSSSYDVFINFRGEDTRNTFVGHLYRALRGRGFHVFIDNKDVRKGEDIEPELLEAIKGSKLSIAVLSKTYAESRWADQSELIEKVVETASIRLNRVPLIDVKYPVGLESRIESLLSLLSNTSSEDVQFLGICGLGGIGKTTIATAFYNRTFRNFSKSCFVHDIKQKASQPNDILLILDDVDNHTQLDALAGDINWFGLGSRIIITTRDQSILGRVPQNNRKVYEPKELNAKESLQLFSSYAFYMDQPPEDYMQLSIDIVHTTGGLPLPLEVLGSDLSMTKDEEVWKSMHRILKQVPHNDVYTKLKISYDNLQDDIEKAMFLDVACCCIENE
ncbi:disease resistance protein Roq1-like [Telopea speciosissima]|uniref:disease resistance protein Roq1-like n=1 Tax=Telopea speciosissima TaxID=54955 RepID=UPI001CC69BB2|nr:disease resistance protein Roq1-like [Telopea speciosissima]